MPVSIYKVMPEGQKNQEVAWLAGEEWKLPQQVAALTEWVEKHGSSLPPGGYVADIGFCWRRDASAGGSALLPALLKAMGDADIALFLSEYPGFADDRHGQTEPSNSES